jgi:uncharacterized lipoprotein YddW (UPF0748 family)
VATPAFTVSLIIKAVGYKELRLGYVAGSVLEQLKTNNYYCVLYTTHYKLFRKKQGIYMRKLTFIFICIALCLNLSAKSIAIVQADVTLPEGGERNYSIGFAKRLGLWLDDDSIAFDMLPESKLSFDEMSKYKVVVFPYSAVLPKDIYTAVSKYIDHGGKLIVFYSNDAKLALRMKLNLKGYVGDPSSSKWQSMVFKEGCQGFPKVVHQNSRSLKPVFPKNESETIAYWHDIDGKKSKTPAVVKTPYGFWVSHVLVNGGSSNAIEQKKLFKGMLLNSGVGSVDQFEKDDIQAVLDRFPLPSKVERKKLFTSREAQAALAGLEVRKNLVENYLKDDKISLAKLQVVLYQEDINKLYGTLYSSSNFTMRGVWDHYATGLYPGDWNITARSLVDAKITDVFINAVWPTKCHYKSVIYPESDTFKIHGDQIEQAIKACKPYGIKVHVWKVCWNMGGKNSDVIKKLGLDKYLQKDYKGNTVYWLCPSVKENVDWELGQIEEIVSKYDIDGIHLDYIRYNNSDVCYCKYCRSGFEKSIGKPVKNWPDDVRNGNLKEEYQKFRVNLISSFVSKVSKRVKSMDSSVQVSAAVFGSYPSCYYSVGQDWPAWVKNGYLDFVVPMNYFNTVEKLDKFVTKQIDSIGKDKLISGIGVSSGASKLSTIETMKQLDFLESKGIKGYVFFDLNKRLETQVFPLLK